MSKPLMGDDPHRGNDAGRSCSRGRKGRKSASLADRNSLGGRRVRQSAFSLCIAAEVLQITESTEKKLSANPVRSTTDGSPVEVRPPLVSGMGGKETLGDAVEAK